MSPPLPRAVLLGPQREGGDLAEAVGELAGSGRAALVTAGWQEWEQDDGRLRVGPLADAVNLRLYGRTEEIWRQDPELVGGHKRLQAKVRLLRRAYNTRLAHAMDAWIDLERQEGDPDVMDVERESALEDVRSLDRHHAGRLDMLRAEFYRQYDPLMRDSVARQRDELREALAPVTAVVIAGGHLPALLNRLRLLGMDQLLRDRAVVAYSAGAMVLAARVVFFHDSPPWGPGHAELGEVGLGLLPGVVALPDAAHRLRLDDSERMTRMARRFAPDRCLLLDAGTRVDWDGAWHARAANHLSPTGGAQRWRGGA